MRKYWMLVIGVVSLATAQNIVQLPDSIAPPGDTVTWVKKIPGYCESPVWEAATGYVYFDHQIGNNVPNWPVWRIKPGVDTGIIFIDTFQNNGTDFDPQGRLIVLQNGRISRYKPDGSLDSTLVTFSNTIQANDLSIGANGSMYFTSYGSSVYYLSPARQMSTAGTGFMAANGIEWLEDENTVYVNETNANRVRKFPVPAGGGALGTAATFIASIPGPDGGTVDSHGNRYVASNSKGEVIVYSALGDSIGVIALRVQSGIYDSVRSSGRVGIASNVDNCVFGGPDLKTLYITGDGGLFSIPLKISGRARPGEPSGITTKNHMKRSSNKTIVGVFIDTRGRQVSRPQNDPAIPVLRLH